MRWARTLMIAEMLTKAIQSNVAHEARSNVNKPDEESPMSDDLPHNTPPATPPSAPAEAIANDQANAVAATPEPEAAHAVAAAPAPKGTAIDVDARLQQATHLAEMLTKNPEIHSFLCALLGNVTEEISKDISA